MNVKYDNIIKILKKYGIKMVGDLKSVVGVDTGSLKSSIDYVVDASIEGEPELIIKFNDYGKFINPWIKKTGSSTIPGYKKVISDDTKTMVKELEKAGAKDILLHIRLLNKKLNK